jgi:hypothetical protein
MDGDKGNAIAQSPQFTALQASANNGEGDALSAVLTAAESALDAGDAERARRLIGVAKELRALGFARGE